MWTIYQHYKGNLYLHEGTALHSETLEPHEVYRCLYDNSKGYLWVRPQGMFHENLEDNRPRFTPIGRVRRMFPEDQREALGFGYDAWGRKTTIDEFIASYDSDENFRRGVSYLFERFDGTLCAKMTSIPFARGIVGFASVATKPEERGKGYASVLVQAVMGLSRHEDPRTRFLLFSEVSPVMYERLGFWVVPEELQLFRPSVAMATGQAPLREAEARFLKSYF